MLKDIEFLEKENQRLNQLIISLQKQYQSDLQNANQEISRLMGGLKEKQEILAIKDAKIEQCERKI